MKRPINLNKMKDFSGNIVVGNIIMKQVWIILDILKNNYHIFNYYVPG